MATEHQEELQVAVVRQRSTSPMAKEEVYEFSVYKEKKPVVQAALYLSASAMALTYAFMATARHKARGAYARRRR